MPTVGHKKGTDRMEPTATHSFLKGDPKTCQAMSGIIKSKQVKFTQRIAGGCMPVSGENAK